MWLKGFSLAFLGVGVFVLMQVLMPFLAFQLWQLSFYDKNQLLVDPTSQGDILGISVENINNFPAIISKNKTSSLYSEFKLTIPTLNLKDLKVAVSSNSFEDNLAHLPGSSLPGEKGNIFITGHSSIDSPLGRSDKRAFFATLPNIKKGEEVILDAFGQRFTYEVLGIKIVDPKDISVVNPPDTSGRYLTLMTCVPPGFNSKRLIVLARLK